jgi:hypothetical protein
VKQKSGVPDAIRIEINTDGFGKTLQPHFGIENSHSLNLDTVLSSLSNLIEEFDNEFHPPEFTQEKLM